MKTQDSTRSRGTARFASLLLVGSLAAAGLAACSDSEPAGDVAKGPASGRATSLTINGDKFEPSILRLDAGEEITIEVSNDDDTAHDFAVESLDLNTGTIEAGDVATATLTVPEEGLEFVCTFHSDMRGRIEAE
ncbi:MAG: cupredoxin domain-containing protein [Actinomycetota bacterium]|nr:cupredoxin domain-containing protein [Actinomycetota bacterium]